MMQIDIITLFPEMFENFLKTSILKRAQDENKVKVRTVNLRDYSTDKHRSVDEPPYGGGGGMVIGPQPFFHAVDALKQDGSKVVLLSPQGRLFTQRVAEELAQMNHIILLCGHYEGIDERVRQNLANDDISIGDYVLTGGETAAMVVVDAVVRLIPGVLGNELSASEESFSMGLLEYPQYTRPREYSGLKVPEVLLSGNHEKIRRWRRKEALRRTLKLRADLFESFSFTEEDLALIREVVKEELESLKY
ncbi:MAG TPA: tRNA (guanosine(37)-N1)-methyltransferase TrmD [Peptococcaceae bacterium]|nr:tRNA (guanosine(37)-N1)-methyltransferase TrmD [Peptococcaceae bacterium]